MDALNTKLEVLVDELGRSEDSVSQTVEKVDQIIQKAVREEDRNSRDYKKVLWELDDLEKIETDLEDKYGKKRLEIIKTRQELRRSLIEKIDKKDEKAKLILSTLLNSQFTSRSPNNRGGSAIGNSSENDEEFMVHQWMLTPKELEYDRSAKPLGSGAFGDVFRGKLRGKDVAIKKLVFQELDEQTLTEFKKEVSVMAKLRHPNIILFMGACLAPGNLSMVVELMDKGSVYDRLHDEKIKLGLLTRLLFAKDTALGMNCLHTQTPSILHLDLKSQNLLIDENWTVKVSDFGLSHIMKTGKTTGKVGSPLYMAPEMLLDKPYDTKADVYSFGIVLWELFTQLEPYNGFFKTFDEMMDGVTRKGKRPDIPEDCPSKLKELMQACWNPDPNNRPSIAKILSSHILDEVIIEAMISPKNDLGRAIWKEKFLEKVVVDWKDFLITFSNKAGFPIPRDPDDIQMQCLKELVVKKSKEGKEEVSLEDFGIMLDWFGPLEKGSGILRRVEAQLRMKGFFGDIETQESEKILNGKKKGAYLVRFSTRDPGCYAITVLSKTGVLKHYRISHKAGGKYVLGQNEYDSMDALIKAHKKELYLDSPLGGSHYETLFVAYDKKLATQGYMDTDQIK